MPLGSPVYMLAVDHRWQWEEWCDAAAVARSGIPGIKHLATDAFLVARATDVRVEAHGALLIDTLFGAAQVDRLMAAGATVGTPAEWPGSSPVRWQTDPMGDALTGRFVKVLVRHRPDDPESIVASEVERLLELQAWCRTQGQPLVLEVVVPRGQEPEAQFDATGRAPIVAAYIRRAYASGLVPDFWKIEGTTDAGAAALVDHAIAAEARPRFLVLGKGAGVDQVTRWFATARTMATATGFAIGRTVYFEPASKWLRGEITRDQACDRIVAGYRGLIDLWESTPGRE